MNLYIIGTMRPSQCLSATKSIEVALVVSLSHRWLMAAASAAEEGPAAYDAID